MKIKSILKSTNSLCELELLRNNLKLSTNDDDEILAIHAKYVESFAEQKTGKYISQTTLEIECDSPFLKIPTGPINSILSLNVDGVSLPTTSENVVFDQKTIKILKNGSKFLIKLLCGYSSFSDLEPELQLVLIEHTSHSYSNRNSRSAKLYPSKCKVFYDKFQTIRI